MTIKEKMIQESKKGTEDEIKKFCYKIWKNVILEQNCMYINNANSWLNGVNNEISNDQLIQLLMDYNPYERNEMIKQYNSSPREVAYGISSELYLKSQLIKSYEEEWFNEAWSKNLIKINSSNSENSYSVCSIEQYKEKCFYALDNLVHSKTNTAIKGRNATNVDVVNLIHENYPDVKMTSGHYHYVIESQIPRKYTTIRKIVQALISSQNYYQHNSRIPMNDEYCGFIDYLLIKDEKFPLKDLLTNINVLESNNIINGNVFVDARYQYQKNIIEESLRKYSISNFILSQYIWNKETKNSPHLYSDNEKQIIFSFSKSEYFEEFKEICDFYKNYLSYFNNIELEKEDYNRIYKIVESITNEFSYEQGKIEAKIISFDSYIEEKRKALTQKEQEEVKNIDVSAIISTEELDHAIDEIINVYQQKALVDLNSIDKYINPSVNKIFSKIMSGTIKLPIRSRLQIINSGCIKLANELKQNNLFQHYEYLLTYYNYQNNYSFDDIIYDVDPKFLIIFLNDLEPIIGNAKKLNFKLDKWILSGSACAPDPYRNINISIWCLKNNIKPNLSFIKWYVDLKDNIKLLEILNQEFSYCLTNMQTLPFMEKRVYNDNGKYQWETINDDELIKKLQLCKNYTGKLNDFLIMSILNSEKNIDDLRNLLENLFNGNMNYLGEMKYTLDTIRGKEIHDIREQIIAGPSDLRETYKKINYILDNERKDKKNNVDFYRNIFRTIMTVEELESFTLNKNFMNFINLVNDENNQLNTIWPVYVNNFCYSNIENINENFLKKLTETCNMFENITILDSNGSSLLKDSFFTSVIAYKNSVDEVLCRIQTLNIIMQAMETVEPKADEKDILVFYNNVILSTETIDSNKALSRINTYKKLIQNNKVNLMFKDEEPINLLSMLTFYKGDQDVFLNNVFELNKIEFSSYGDFYLCAELLLTGKYEIKNLESFNRRFQKIENLEELTEKNYNVLEELMKCEESEFDLLYEQYVTTINNSSSVTPLKH